MATNWPPSGAPSWPPPEVGSNWLSCSDIRALAELLRELGFTKVNPTAQENNNFFKNATCDEGHSVIGRMLVSPGGTRYPVAICSGIGHRTMLALWSPNDIGWDTGREA